VRNRLLKDDFVVEDGDGQSGYVDNGQDDWLEEGMNGSGDESDRAARKSCASMFSVTLPPLSPP